MQAVFSSVFYLSSVALYQGFLMVGYATVYTMFPVSIFLLLFKKFCFLSIVSKKFMEIVKQLYFEKLQNTGFYDCMYYKTVLGNDRNFEQYECSSSTNIIASSK